MSVHLSVATAIEKDRVASDVAFVLLLDIAILDQSTLDVVETLSIARNTEVVTYGGTDYQPANFSVKLDLDAQSEPSLQITSVDPTGYIRNAMEAYSGGVGSNVTLTVVNTGNLSAPPEIQESFQITEAAQQGYTVTFTMGIDSPVAIRFPYRIQWQDQCPYRYKGPRCQYSGDLTTCDFTYAGANGCVVHANQANFGAFLGLNNTQGQ